ncbi:hypothetical protein A1OE_77 [Candidatus Endolissoclinum faulkneri L2]|uniref:Transmembrane protein n=1 Tax=Candidatus Endolissoclinum faulkneri L2 TaxID=1193729 RepID=K7ZC47_9PROT|nr:DUF502 domain-containing protein [Candidatus Endolissoclinum faulkneri]AFX98291.1 hypothetical protein A1OE_77 [Candidatus Endolissoclinum faulkneri L2]
MKSSFKAVMFLRLRTYFLAGVVVTAPIGITLYIAWLIINIIDDRVTPLIPVRYNPETYLPFDIPGFGVIVAVAVLTIIGAFTAGLVGRWLVSLSERLMARMPLIRNIHSALKQILETVLAQQSKAFRQVVMIEYPRRGIWAIGFLTSDTVGEVQNITTADVVNVFLPTTPNPTSGFLLFVPRRDCYVLSMTVEEGIKMVVSGGIITPPDHSSSKKSISTLR